MGIFSKAFRHRRRMKVEETRKVNNKSKQIDGGNVKVDKILKRFVGFLKEKKYATQTNKTGLRKRIEKLEAYGEPREIDKQKEEEDEHAKETIELKFYSKNIIIKFNRKYFQDDEKKVKIVEEIIEGWMKQMHKVTTEIHASRKNRVTKKKLRYVVTREILKLGHKLITKVDQQLKEEKSREILNKLWNRNKLVLLFGLTYACPYVWRNHTKKNLAINMLFETKKENRGKIREKMRDSWNGKDTSEEIDDMKYMFPELNNKETRELRKKIEKQEKIIEEEIKTFETRVLNNTEKLYKDSKKHIESETRILCRECPRSFSTTNTRWQHESSIHKGVTHICETCGKKLTTVGNLRRHERIHEEIHKKKNSLVNKVEERLLKQPTMMEIVENYKKSKDNLIQAIEEKKSPKEPSMLDLFSQLGKIEKVEQKLINESPTKERRMKDMINKLSREMKEERRENEEKLKHKNMENGESSERKM